MPLFYREPKSGKTGFCNVDLLLIKGGKIKVILEIEESDTTPVRICGKFLVTALSNYFNHASYRNEANVFMDESVTFIQIVDTVNLKMNTSKVDQWKNIEKAIKSILPLINSRVSHYKIFEGTTSQFKKKNSGICKKFTRYLGKSLK